MENERALYISEAERVSINFKREMEKDTFKIIYVKNGRGSYLEIVPHQWDQNNIAYWPPNNLKRCQKLGWFKPEPSWKSDSCVVKRCGFETFDEANKELEKMLADSTTSSSDVYGEDNIETRSKRHLPKHTTSDLSALMPTFHIPPVGYHKCNFNFFCNSN